MADPTRRFDDTEADAILRRVIDRQRPRGALDRNDLVETARQLGIASDEVDDAIAEHDEQSAIDAEVAAWRAQHLGALRTQAIAFGVTSAGLLALAAALSGVAAWVLVWPLLGWAVGLVSVWARVRQGPDPATLESVRVHEQRKAERAARRRELAERAARQKARTESLQRIFEGVDDAVTRGLTKLADNLGLRDERPREAAPRRTGVRIAAPDATEPSRDDEVEIEAELERLRAKRRQT